jgi:hypothetical protein
MIYPVSNLCPIIYFHLNMIEKKQLWFSHRHLQAVPFTSGRSAFFAVPSAPTENIGRAVCNVR